LEFEGRELKSDREDGVFLIGTLTSGLVDADYFGRDGVADVDA